MIRIKNASQDRTKTLLHRTAPKLEMEPVINGQRLRLGTYTDVPEEWVEKNKAYLEGLVKTGVIDIKFSDRPAQEIEYKLDANGKKLGGPTLEEYLKAGYSADRYPPFDYAEVPSAGLTALRNQQALAKAAEAKAKEEAEFAALVAAEEAAKKVTAEAAVTLIQETTALPSITEQVLPAVPVAEVAPSEEKPESKKGPGKKKLF